MPRGFCVPGGRTRPRPVLDSTEMKTAGHCENWVCYRSSASSTKELTVDPGAGITVHDSAAYGLIVRQGHGTLNGLPVETPRLIRFGQLTHDEDFVSEATAKEGVRLDNPSHCDPIVMLKYFGPQNPRWT